MLNPIGVLVDRFKLSPINYKACTVCKLARLEYCLNRRNSKSYCLLTLQEKFYRNTRDLLYERDCIYE